MAAKKSQGAKSAEPTGYAEAMAEIDAILAELDSPNVDVDVLGDKVNRASELISWCSDRIAAAEFTVKALVDSLDLDAEETDDEADDEWDDEGDDF